MKYTLNYKRNNEKKRIDFIGQNETIKVHSDKMTVMKRIKLNRNFAVYDLNIEIK